MLAGGLLTTEPPGDPVVHPDHTVNSGHFFFPFLVINMKIYF